MAQSGRLLKVDSELKSFDILIEKKDLNSLERLIDKHGINFFDSSKRTILINSIIKGVKEVVVFAINKGIDLDFQDRSGYSALHFAALYCQPEITDLLIDKGANVNIRDEHGNTPIWTAIFNAKDDFLIVKKLYRAGGDIETKNKHNKSPREFGETVYGDKFLDLIKE